MAEATTETAPATEQGESQQFFRSSVIADGVDVPGLIKGAGMSDEDAAEHYATLALVASTFPDALTYDQWVMLGAYSRDGKVTQGAYDYMKANNFADPGEFLGADPLFNFLSDRGTQTVEPIDPVKRQEMINAVGMGRIVPPPWKGNPWAELGFDLATIATSLGVAYIGSRGLIAAGKVAVGTRVGASVTSVIKAAGMKMTPGLKSLLTWTRRVGVVGLGTAGGIQLAQLRHIAMTDPEDVIEEINRQRFEAEFEKQGGRIDYNVTAGAGEAFETGETVYTDADGKVISYEDMMRETGLSPVEFDQELGDIIDSGTGQPIAAGTPQTDRSTGDPAPLSEQAIVVGAPGDVQSFGNVDLYPFNPDGTVNTDSQVSPLLTMPLGEVKAMVNNESGGISITQERYDEIVEARATYEQARVKQLMDDQYQKNPYVGVDRTYWRSKFGDRKEMEGKADTFQDLGVPYSVVEAYRRAGRPIYHQQDIDDTVANMSPLKLLSFQEQLINAGMIDPDSTVNGRKFRPGILDERTFEGMAVLQGLANAQGDGTTWQEMLDYLETTYEAEPDEGRRPWVPSTAYFKPDYATLAQSVDGLFKQQLGRDPNGWERELLAEEYSRAHREQYDVAMENEKFVYDAVGRAEETGEVPNMPVYEDVDPAARTAEKFDAMMEPELNARSRWDDVRSKTSNLFGSFDRLGKA